MKHVDKRFLFANVALATAASAILVWISLEANTYARKVQEDLRRATATAKADRALAQLTQLTLEAESGQRFFLLTQNGKFLGDLNDSRDKALAEINDYHDLRATLGDEAPAIDAPLRKEIETKFAELSRTLDLARAGKTDEAINIVRDESGAETMRRIHTIVTDACEKLEASRRRYRGELTATAARLLQTTRQGAIDIFLLSAVAVAAVTWHSRQLIRTRQALRQANQQLETRVAARTRQLVRSNEELQRYAHIVGHDLRAPLVNIMGFTRELQGAEEVLKAYVDAARSGAPFDRMKEVYAAVDEDAPEALRFIHASLARMDTLIAAILKLSRQGHAALHPQPIDMRELVEDCLSQIRRQLDDAGGEATILPPLPDIVSDAVAVKQIFTNLLDNAVKYFAPGRPGRIVVSGAASGAMAYFQVRDNGRGVAPQDKERIFDLFRRAGPQDRPGEGVGLAHVRVLARRLGGEISVESDGMSGSSFHFSLARNLDAVMEQNGKAEP